jgi:NitT/TauT family transport system substrate-binding protein
MKKTIIALILLTVALIACGPKSLPTPASGLISVRLPVGYIPHVQFAPLYVAIEKGFYRDLGLEVKMDYINETDSVALVGADEIQFAIVSGEQVPLGRAQGLPVVYVLDWYQQYPVGVVSMADQNIRTPADLKGKKVGIPVLAGASYIGFKALLDAGKINDTDVTLDSIGFTQTEALIDKLEDAVVIYVTNEPIKLRAEGYQVNVLKVSDYLALVGNGLITNQKTIDEKPGLVRAMVAGTLAGIKYTIAHPDEAFGICKKYVENLAALDQNLQREILAASIELWKADKLGFSNMEAWVNMNNLLINMKLLKQPLELTPMFTNEFLPK